jgi:type IV pilus assembly protein PilE
MFRTRIATPSSSIGFTLLELMITVAVIGILAAIAIPLYSDYVTRSKIIDGTLKLGDYRTQMEKYFMDNRTYIAAGKCGPAIPAASGNDSFTITCVAAAGPPETYVVTATGIGTHGMANFVYTIDQANAKASTGPGGNYTNGACWALRKDGSC